MNTISFNFKKSLFQVVTAVMIVILSLTILPIPSAYAADTGLQVPIQNANNGWTNPGNAYASDNNRTVANSGNDEVEYYGFDFSAIPAGATINGIEVLIEGYQEGGGTPRQADISLSWNGGSNFTTGAGTGVKTTNMPGTTAGAEALRTFGGPADTWNRTWSASDFTNFRVLVDANLGSNGSDLLIDQIRVRVTYTSDTTSPSVTSISRQTPATAATNADILVFQVIFSEAVVNVSTADFTVNGTTTATVTNVATISSTTYDVAVSGGNLAGFNGVVGLNLNGSQNITDSAGNALPTVEPGTDQTYTLDNIAPTVTINQQTTPPQADPTNVSPINFAVVFSETITNFATGDVSFTGSTVGGTLTGTVTGSGTTYNVAVTGMTTAGNVIASINPSVATDAVGNSNTSATFTDNVIAYTTPVITAMAGVGGTITPSGSVSVISGADQSFDIAPNSPASPATSFIVSNVVVDGSSQPGRPNTYTFSDVDDNHTISAGFDGGWSFPTGNVLVSGNFNNIGNGYTSNNLRAISASFIGLPLAGSFDYLNFNIPSIPAGSAIDGIEVSVEGFTTGDNIQVSLTGTGSAPYTTFQTTNLGGNESTIIVGSPTNLWGTTWTSANFNNANFRVHINFAGGGGLGTQLSLDQVQVKVYYRQPTGLTVSAASGVYGGTVDLTATLTAPAGGSGVSDQTIIFTLNGFNVGTATTNGSGVATLNNVDLKQGVNTWIDVGTYPTGVEASFAGASGSPGYVASNATNTLTVDPRALIVSATGVDKVYDGNTDATVTLSDNSVSGDTLTLNYASASFDTKHVGSGKTVTVNGITIGGADAGNYTLSNTDTTTTASITQRPITMMAVTDSKEYDGNTSSDEIPIVSALTPVATGDSAAFIQTFDTPAIGGGKTLTPSGIVNDGNSGNNYDYSFVSVNTGEVTPRSLTITGVTANNKPYDGSNTATLNTAGAGLSVIVGTEDVSLDSTSVTAFFDDENAGNGKNVTASGFTLSGADAGNYTLIQPISLTADITPRALTVTATGVNKVYNGTNAATVTLSDDRVAGDTITVTYGSATFNNENVGNNKPISVTGIDVTGPDAGNYTFNITANTTANITPRALTVTATGIDKIYDGTTYATVTLSDNRIVGDILTLTYTGATFDTPNVGNNKPVNVTGIDVTGADSGNYTFNTTASTTADITPVDLTITANDDGKVYDKIAYSGGNGVIYNGFVGSDNTGNALSGTLTYGGTSQGAVNANAYTIIPGGLTANNGNYNIIFASGTLTISKRPITVTAVTDTKPYDANTSSDETPIISAGTPLAAGDTDNFIQIFDNKNVGMGKILTPSGIVNDGNSGNNYDYSFVSVNTGEITGITLTVSGISANNKVYDGTATATLNTGGAALVIVKPGDTVTLVGAGTATGTFADNPVGSGNGKNVGGNKAVNVSGLSLGGMDAGNYILISPIPTANITARPITVTAQTNTKVYDATTGSATNPTITTGTLAAGDTPNFTEAYSNSNVGTSKLLIPDGEVNDGNGGGNYAVTFINNTTGVIQARPLTVTADPKAKAFGSPDPAFTYVFTGTLVGGDTLSGTLTRVSGEAVGTYAILQGSLSAGPNYAITYNGALLTISIINQTITVVTPAPPSAAYNSSFNVAATASSGLPVTITTTGGACSGSGTNTATIIMISGVETCTVHYNQAGDSNYSPALEVLNTITAQKASQTIIVNAPGTGTTATYNTGFNAAATATSGLPVVYSSVGVCTNILSNFTMTSGTGICTVQYNQAGDDNYSSAPQVTRTVTAQKANQSINVTTSAPGTATFNSNFTVAATASSGLPVAYSAAGSCNNAGANFTMTSSTGSCSVQFNQTGDDNYNAAPQVTQTVTAQKANQTITVTTSAPLNAAYNSSFTVVATASSGLPVSYNAVGSCTNAGSTFTMTSSTGTCTVQYDQPGDADYNPAPQVAQAVNAQKANQTISVTIAAPANAAYNSDFTVAATASSGLPVVYSASGVCTNVGATFTMTASTGTCQVQYNQAGNANYNAALQVTETVNAQPADQTITVITSAPVTSPNGSNFTVAATASSGLPVTYSASGVCTNVGATFTMTASTGNCTVHYNQAGNGNYNPAPEVTESTSAEKIDQTISVTTSAPASAVNNSSFNVDATASSGLGVAITTSGVCNGSGTGSATITITSGTGTCTVHYNQAGDTNYNAAPEITEDVSAFAAPDTTIDSNPPDPDSDTTPSFTFSSTDPTATFVCQVDGGGFAACNSGDSFGPLGSGNHTFEVSAVDTFGNTDPTPASYIWTIDTSAPNTAIDTNPPAVTNSITAAFTFSSGDNDLAGFECQLDGGGFSSCTSPQNYGGLSGGSHTFEVRAVDTAGNNDPSPASYTWVVDLGYPTVLFNGNTVPSNNSTVGTGPTQIKVAFSKDVKNDGSAGAANLTANYLLVEDGVNGAFDTLSCVGGLVADDVTIPMTIPIYTNGSGTGPFIATSIVNGGTRLPDGKYRLFVCGTTSIEDLAGNKLNNGASDTTITFTVQRGSGNGGGGGGNNNGGTGTTQTVNGLLIPVTGFPQGKITELPAQPADKAYAETDLWIEIPKLNVKVSIVGVPQTEKGWDISWLGKNAGWLNGSAFPTWKGNSVITAHVWDTLNKPGPFAGLINLTYGDQVKVHAFGQVYTYEITESSLILPTNITAAFKHEDKASLTLITCENYIEKTDVYTHRRMVRAVLVSVEKEK